MSAKKTPEEWEAEYGLEVRDPDGWRRDNTPWERPLTLPDFWSRYCGSTARLLTEHEYERILADVKAAKREDAEADTEPVAPPMPKLMSTKTTGRRVRIENRNPEGKKILSGGRITVDGEDISDHVLAVDIHMDPRSLPTARLEMIDLDVDIEAVEAEPEDAITGDVLTAGADPLICVNCYIEHHAGTRDLEAVNDATMIVGGNSACTEHVVVQTGPALPGRTASGLIL